MKRIELHEGRPPLRDIQNGLRMHYRKARLGWILVVVGILLALIGCFCLGLLTQDLFLIDLSITLLPGVLVLAAFPFFLIPYVIPRRWAKQIAELGDLSTVIDDSGILEKADKAHAFHGWDAVTKYTEDRDGINIYFVGGQFKYIPKRLLGAEEEDELKVKLTNLA